MLDAYRDQGVEVENRLRLASPCRDKACAQWQADRCGLADRAVADVREAAPSSRALPRCAIRPSCRWFFQHLQQACLACPDVVRKPAALYGDAAAGELGHAARGGPNAKEMHREP